MAIRPGRVYHADALSLLRLLPAECIDAVISDPMYGTSRHGVEYDWGCDPAMGDPMKHWQYHEPIYQECRRVLKPNGVLAWGCGAKFCMHFQDWFQEHHVWTLTRFRMQGKTASGHVWVVQTREQRSIRFPDKDGIVIYKSLGKVRLKYPCIKPPEEPAFLIENLTQPGHIVLDMFCGLGSTLVAAKMLGRQWIGCDRSKGYCREALKQLALTDNNVGY